MQYIIGPTVQDCEKRMAELAIAKECKIITPGTIHLMEGLRGKHDVFCIGKLPPIVHRTLERCSLQELNIEFV